MKLVEETKTYKVPLEQTVEFDNVQDVVNAVIYSMPEWGLKEHRFDADAWEVYVTVRRRNG